MKKSPVTDLDVALVYNNIEEYPNLRDVAKHLGLTEKTVRNRVGRMRGAGEVELIDRANLRYSEEPISERPELFMEHWTPSDCIEHLRRFYLANDESASRNSYRKMGGVSESTWNRYFGTFEEFQRQAGIKLSRGARQIELNIARHASRDPMESLNAEKREFSGRYQRDSGRRHRTVLVASDIHDKDCDPFYRRVFLDTAARVQPDCIFLNGDIFDLPEFGRYTQDPRTWDVVGRVKWVHEFLRELRESCPDAHIVFLEGNHEFRLIRHLAEATPALKSLLGDLHGFSVSSLLGLDEFELEYVGLGDLRAWSNTDVNKQIAKNNYFLWDALLGDHFPSGKNEGVPGWNGHHHKFVGTPVYSRQYGSSMWYQIGGGHVRRAEYCNGRIWQNGFLMVHCDTETKQSVFEPIEVRDMCVVGGEFYYRQENETWHADQMFYSNEIGESQFS